MGQVGPFSKVLRKSAHSGEASLAIFVFSLASNKALRFRRVLGAKKKKCQRQKRKEYKQKLTSHRNAQRNISKRWQLDLAPQNDVTVSKAEIFDIQ